MANSPAQGITVPQLHIESMADGASRIELLGNWNLIALEHRVAELTSQLAAFSSNSAIQWDLRGIDIMDHAGAMVLWRAWGRQRAANLVLKPEHEMMFSHLAPAMPAPAQVPRDWLRPLVVMGQKLLGVIDHFSAVLMVLGQVMLDAAFLIRKPSSIPWREISANVYRTGAQALGITALVGFLVGVVLSYLSAQQLKLFGADAFIINILGISVVRELGPVLAAILIAGRSGSAITAQLGVMRVTQELDAMVVMGIPHTLRLILPKMIALAISMPLIVLWTNAIALIGGMVSANAELGIGYIYFLSSLPDAVPVENLWLGLGKGVVFGFLIALVACHFGLRIEPNTESLGVGTTSAVVTSITVVIIVDAIFAILFKDIGIG